MSTHEAPPTTNTSSVSGSHGLNAATNEVSPKPMVATRTSDSFAKRSRAAALRSAPHTAPPPNVPKSTPYVSAPPPSKSRAMSGISAQIALPSMPSEKARNSTARIAGCSRE